MTLANTTKKDVSAIEGLAMEARALRNCIDVNMWQLARVFVEAKPLVPHGEWEKWLEVNADCSVRTAQDMIAAFKRFGGKPQLENIGRSKAFKLLPLPEGAEEKFMQEHDVSSMSAREIEKAVKAAREEEREKAKADAEEQIRKAEDEARETVNEAWRKTNAKLEETEQQMEDLKAQLSDSRGIAEALRIAVEDAEARAQAATQAAIDGAKDVSAQSAKLNAEAEKMRRELQDRDEMIAELQDQYNRVQTEYLNLQSTVAKGDAERAPADQLTPEVLAAAVRSFIGATARMPHMRTAFAMMDDEKKEEYSILLETIETWAKGSREALETTGAEGTVI